MLNKSPDFGAGRHAKILGQLAGLAVAVPPVARARIVAAIYHKGSLVALGNNQRKSHPFQAKYGKNKESIYLHAEINTICKALKELSVEEMKDCIMYVCRIKYSLLKDWASGLSCPCPGCQRAIAEFGIKEVYFSMDGGSYGQL